MTIDLQAIVQNDWFTVYLILQMVVTVALFWVVYMSWDCRHRYWSWKNWSIGIRAFFLWPIIFVVLLSYFVFVISQFIMKLAINHDWKIQCKLSDD